MLLMLGILFTFGKAQTVADSLKQIFGQSKGSSEEFFYALQLGRYYTGLQNDSAQLYLLHALSYSIQHNDSLKKVEALALLSRLKRQTGEYDKALNYDLQQLRIAEQMRDSSYMASASNTVGINHYRMRNRDKALEYFEHALSIREELKDSVGMADVMNNIAMIYDDREQFREALWLYKKALQIYTGINQTEAMADTYNNIAGSYYKMGDIPKVIEYANKALQLWREDDYKPGLAFLLINIGSMYQQTGDSENALKSIKEGLSYAEELGMLSQIRQGHKNLAEIYESRNNFKQAYRHAMQYNAVNDSLFNKEKQRIAEDIQTKYETEKKETLIGLLHKENTIKELELNKTKLFWIASMVMALLTGVLLLMLLSRARYRKKVNLILEDKNRELAALNSTKDKLFAIMAHDLRNPVSAFKTLTQTISAKSADLTSQEMRDYSNVLAQSAEDLLGMLNNLLIWAKSQRSKMQCQKAVFSPADIAHRVFVAHRLQAQQKRISMFNELDDRLNISNDPRMTETILRNLVSNAIKFTDKGGEIRIYSNKKNNAFELCVSDTGIGMSKEEQEHLFNDSLQEKIGQHKSGKGTGLGLILSKELVGLCGGTLRVESKIGEGSIFIVSLPENCVADA